MNWPTPAKQRGTPEQTLVHRPIMQLVEMHIERIEALRGLIHVPNEGKRTQAGHGILIGLGMRPGVSDLILLRARRGYRGLAMELKAPGGLNQAKPPQKAFLRQQHAEGWLCCLCDDAEAGWRLIHWYVTGACHAGEPERFLSPDAHLRWVHQL